MHEVFKEFTFKEYNPQRNKGILYDNKNNDDFKRFNEFINDNLKNKVQLKKLENNNNIPTYTQTLLDLIGVDRQEEVYTNIIYYLLKDNKEIAKELFSDYIENDFEIFNEYSIPNGRFDLMLRTDKNINIIENKIDSGLNGKDQYNRGKNQINTYLEYYKKDNKKINERDKDDIEKNVILYILAPDYNLDNIKEEVETFNNLQDKNIKFLGYSKFVELLDSVKINGTLNKYETIINQAFINLSYKNLQDFYMAIFVEQIKRTKN